MTTLRSGSATDVGKVRTTNQDVVLEEPGLFAVADGMGGHAGGEVAARVAVDSLRLAFHRSPTVEGLRRAVAEANRAVWRHGQSERDLRGMGTTLTATALVEEPGGRQVVALANVGDSRAYVYSRGQVIQVTADHSLAEEKVRQGQLTEAEAAVHPQRHVLTRALGVSVDVDVDLWKLHLHAGDRVLLCSDGLTNEIGDERIGQILDTELDPSDAAKALVTAALDHGGSDNVTCVVIDVVSREPAAATGTARVATLAGGIDEDDTPETSADEKSSADEETADGAGSAGATRTLRALSGTGAGASSEVGRSAVARGRGDGTTTIDPAARPAALPAAGGRSGEGAGGANGRSVQASGGVHANSRLQAAELRRLHSSPEGRRRRAPGAQRILTVRLVLFVLLLLGVVAAAYFALRWYAMDEWYVGIDHGHLTVYQGRPGGLLWFKPRLVDETRVTIHGIMPYRIPQLRGSHEEGSLSSAKAYVKNLHSEYLHVEHLAARSPSSPTSGAGTGGTTSTSADAFSARAGTWH